jgi:hypothetical protein
MKSKALTLAAVAAAGVLIASPVQAQDMEMPKAQTISAKVIDMACYINAGLTGDDHKMCTEVCAKAGVPLVFLTDDGGILLPTGMGMPSTSQNDKLIEFSEQKVSVTGPVMERAGARTIIVQKIEKAGY